MQELTLSMCFPTYNRLKIFKENFEKALLQLETLPERMFSQVEVVVSINPTEDGNEEMIQYIKSMALRFSMHININEKNIGANPNILKSIEIAKGKYVWVIGDDDLVLPGVIENVLNAIEKHPDITWLFLNEALLAGSAGNENTPLFFVRRYHGESGYYPDGKEKIIEMHKKIDGGILFSSSNIYLRSSMEKVLEKVPMENMCNQLTATFFSASQGAAYIISEPSILAGGETTWQEKKQVVALKYYNEALMLASGLGYSQREMKNVVRYRMCHAALSTWVPMLLLMVKQDLIGKAAYKFAFRWFPITTLLITLGLPFIAIYIFIRSRFRRIKRNREIMQYPNEANAKTEIVKHCMKGV